MFRSFWRSFDRFSLHHFKCIVDELQEIEDVDVFNMEVVVDLLQSLVEIVSYGDKHDPSIFECFMEHQVLLDFVRMLEITRNSWFQAKVLQYLSIIIQNLNNEHAIYYCFSNGYINKIIQHDYEFQDGDLVLYYVSLLRAVSGKLNRDMVSLLVEVQEGIVISFPLYTEALKFAHHGEKMIQISVRSLTLSIYNVSDDVVYQFLVTPPASEYFSDVIHKLKEECVHLDATVSNMRNHGTIDKRDELIDGTVKLLDNLFFVRDLFCVGNSCLSSLVFEKLLDLLVVPIVMQQGESNGVNISAVTSLYFLSRLLQVLDKKEILDSVALLILYFHVAMITSPSVEANAVDNNKVTPSSEYLSKIKECLCSSVDSQDVDNWKVLRCAVEHKLPACHLIGHHKGDLQERKGIFSYIFSDKLGLQLASLMLLLVLAESEDLGTLLSSIFDFPQTCTKIFNILLHTLGSTPPSKATHLHVGWFIAKLICLQRSVVSHHEWHPYNVSLNALISQTRERLLTELSGGWFDYIPDTFEKEWTRCRTVLEESSSRKDPFFVLEIATAQQVSDGNSFNAWQKMVDVVKTFVLYLQLKTYLIKGFLPSSPRTTLPRIDQDSFVRFGSEVSLASGIPCKIAFSKLGLRDIFVIPVAKGISGKLLLVEKHPFHSRRGIIFATAPLAGLSPKTDEEQATWLHLHVRDLNPHLSARKSNSDPSGCQKDARWILGFSDLKTREAASLLIAEETFKQRSAVESSLAPYLSDSYPADSAAIGGNEDTRQLK